MWELPVLGEVAAPRGRVDPTRRVRRLGRRPHGPRAASSTCDLVRSGHSGALSRGPRATISRWRRRAVDERAGSRASTGGRARHRPRGGTRFSRVFSGARVESGVIGGEERPSGMAVVEELDVVVPLDSRSGSGSVRVTCPSSSTKPQHRPATGWTTSSRHRLGGCAAEVGLSARHSSGRVLSRRAGASDRVGLWPSKPKGVSSYFAKQRYLAIRPPRASRGAEIVSRAPQEGRRSGPVLSTHARTSSEAAITDRGRSVVGTDAATPADRQRSSSPRSEARCSPAHPDVGHGGPRCTSAFGVGADQLHVRRLGEGAHALWPWVQVLRSLRSGPSPPGDGPPAKGTGTSCLGGDAARDGGRRREWCRCPVPALRCGGRRPRHGRRGASAPGGGRRPAVGRSGLAPAADVPGTRPPQRRLLILAAYREDATEAGPALAEVIGRWWATGTTSTSTVWPRTRGESGAAAPGTAARCRGPGPAPAECGQSTVVREFVRLSSETSGGMVPAGIRVIVALRLEQVPRRRVTR